MPFSVLVAVVALVLAVAAPASAGVLSIPDTAIDAGPAQFATVTTDPTFEFSGTGTGFECSVDGAGWEACTSPYTPTGLAAEALPTNTGGHTFQVRSVVAGPLADDTPASRTFILDPQGTVQCTITDEDGGTVSGTPGNDVICIGDAGATVDGGAGKDVVVGGPGADVIDGGTGDDSIWGGPGDDDLDGGAADVGFDRIDGGAGADTINGGPGIDRAMYDRRSADVAVTLDDVADDGEAGEGDNVGTDVESVTGGEGSDDLTGSDAPNTFSGRGGDDTLVGGLGDDFMGGGAGADDFSGGEGTASLDRVTYSDYGAGTPVTVTLDDNADDGAAGEGDNVRADIEYVYGGAGDDTITAPAARETGVAFWGNGGNDTLTSAEGADALYGGTGVDDLKSNGGPDIVRGNLASDNVDCGTGTDQYEWDYTTRDKYGASESFNPAAGLCEDEIDPQEGRDTDGDGDVDAVDCADLDPDVNSGAVDNPEMGFADTNCDGVDGKVSSSIFVSSSGNNANPGTKASPVATVDNGIAKATAQGKQFVLVTTGTFTGGASAADNVGVYGGYAANFASRSSTAGGTQLSGSPQAVLADSDQNVKFQMITLHGDPDGNRSAYGLRALAGSTVTLERVTCRAAAGTAGATGSTGGTGTGGTTGPNGNGGSCDGGHGNGIGGATGAGQKGGDGGKGGNEGNNAGAAGGTGTGTGGGSAGSAGGGGNPGKAGGNGGDATQSGSTGGRGNGATNALTSAGLTWAGALGSSGDTGGGGPGGGGGGGGGGQGCTFCNNGGGNGGGGGGSGGGGGAGGAPGGYGGGSFGAYVHNSTLLAADGTVFISNNGGTGGAGGNGGSGGAGGDGGAGAAVCTGEVGRGGNGGKGGSGGTGGRGGGGAGGPSFGVFKVAGATVTLTSATFQIGAGGTGGTSAAGGNGANGQAGNTN